MFKEKSDDYYLTRREWIIITQPFPFQLPPLNQTVVDTDRADDQNVEKYNAWIESKKKWWPPFLPAA